MPKVSIIIPCFNQAQYLEDALQSVLDQTHQNWECIIVNDGSFDDTEVVAKHICEKDSRFIYFFKENGGLSSARNFGIKVAKGEFILTLDADDKYESTFIEKALAVMVTNNKIGVVSSWGIRFDEKQQYGVFKPTGKSLNDFLFSSAAIGTSLFRKVCWEDVGGYDENMKKGYEDWEFYIRVCQLNWNVHIIEEILFFYRQHTVSMRIEALNNYDKEIRKYIFLKHKNLYINNFDNLLEYFFYRIEREEFERVKNTQRLEFRIGENILRPLRWIKSFFR